MKMQNLIFSFGQYIFRTIPGDWSVSEEKDKGSGKHGK